MVHVGGYSCEQCGQSFGTAEGCPYMTCIHTLELEKKNEPENVKKYLNQPDVEITSEEDRDTGKLIASNFQSSGR